MSDDQKEKSTTYYVELPPEYYGFRFMIWKDDKDRAHGQLIVPSDKRNLVTRHYVYEEDSEQEVLKKAKHDILIDFPGSERPNFSW